MKSRVKELYDRGKYVNEHLANSTRVYKVHSFLDKMMAPVLVVLLAVLYFEFFGHLSHTHHVYLKWVEKGILVYFILEIFVDFLLYEENKKFLRHKWFDIILVLPFFAALKSVRGLKFLKFLKPAKGAKAAKAGKAAHGAKAAKGARIAKHGRGVQHFTKWAKKSWEKAVNRVIKEGEEVVEEAEELAEEASEELGK